MSMFFATRAVTSDGTVAGGIYDLMLKALAKNAKEVFYLVDHKKVDQPFETIYCDFRAVQYVISDYDFPAETKKRYPETEFVIAKE